MLPSIVVWLLNCLGQKLLDPVESLVELLTSHEPAVVVRANRIAVERETEGLLEGLVSGVGVGFAGSSWEGAAPWTIGGLAVREPPPRAAKLRVYIDTSVIGGCEDEGFRRPSRRLIERCMRGEVKLVVSAVTVGELRQAPPPVR